MNTFHSSWAYVDYLGYPQLILRFNYFRDGVRVEKPDLLQKVGVVMVIVVGQGLHGPLIGMTPLTGVGRPHPLVLLLGGTLGTPHPLLLLTVDKV